MATVVQPMFSAAIRVDLALGRSVASVGNINRRGFLELVMGAPKDDEGKEDEGTVSVFFVSGDGVLLIDNFER